MGLFQNSPFATLKVAIDLLKGLWITIMLGLRSGLLVRLWCSCGDFSLLLLKLSGYILSAAKG